MENYLKRLESYKDAQFPRDLSEFYQTHKSISPVLSKIDFHKIHNQLSAPLDYYINMPNKKSLRSILCLIFGDALGINDDQTLLLIGRTVQIIHNSSLLIDDIEDSSLTRRGVPTAQTKYLIPDVINSGCFGYFFALDYFLSQYNKPLTDSQKWRISQAMYRVFLEGHVGNAFDLADHKGVTIESRYSVKEYEHATMLKTTPLFLLSLWIIAAIYDVPQQKVTELEQAIHLLGLGFQILNDLDAQDPKNSQFGNDLLEKKMSFPLLVFWETHSESDPKKAEFVALFNGPYSQETNLKFRDLIDTAVKESYERVDQVQKTLEEHVMNNMGNLPGVKSFVELFVYFKKKMSNK